MSVFVNEWLGWLAWQTEIELSLVRVFSTGFTPKNPVGFWTRVLCSHPPLVPTLHFSSGQAKPLHICLDTVPPGLSVYLSLDHLMLLVPLGIFLRIRFVMSNLPHFSIKRCCLFSNIYRITLHAVWLDLWIVSLISVVHRSYTTGDVGGSTEICLNGRKLRLGVLVGLALT